LNNTLSSADLRGLAVNFDGSIYAAGWNGTIYALNNNGSILNSRTNGINSLTDIDLDSSGRLVVGSRFGISLHRYRPSNQIIS
jgi:ligand-binding sensor domain-containing protein